MFGCGINLETCQTIDGVWIKSGIINVDSGEMNTKDPGAYQCWE